MSSCDEEHGHMSTSSLTCVWGSCCHIVRSYAATVTAITIIVFAESSLITIYICFRARKRYRWSHVHQTFSNAHYYIIINVIIYHQQYHYYYYYYYAVCMFKHGREFGHSKKAKMRWCGNRARIEELYCRFDNDNAHVFVFIYISMVWDHLSFVILLLALNYLDPLSHSMSSKFAITIELQAGDRINKQRKLHSYICLSSLASNV